MKNLIKSRPFLLIVTLIPVLFFLVMIYGFSAQPGEESMKTSGEIVEKVLEITEPELDQKPVQEQEIIISNTQFWVRKTAHFSEFLGLGFFLSLHILLWSRRFYPLFATLIGILYAAGDEIHQVFTGSRTPQVRDVLIDSAGLLCGVLLLTGLVMIIRQIIKKHPSEK